MIAAVKLAFTLAAIICSNGVTMTNKMTWLAMTCGLIGLLLLGGLERMP